MAARRNTPWSIEEVQTFLSLVADERIQRELEGPTRNDKVYKELSELLAAQGYRKTPQQCREKLKKLKSYYRSVKDHNGRSGSYNKSWKWFGKMDAIYGHKPASNGREGSLDSPTPSLEPPMEDDYVSISEEGSVTPDEAPLELAAASTPAPEAAPPTPAASSANMTPQRVFTGKRKRQREREQEHVTVLREMLAADVEQQELTRAQRERHHQMALDDAVRAREQDAALRREENAQAAAFNQAFLSTLSQLVQACGPSEIRADGLRIPELLEAILKLFPLDTYVDRPAAVMDLVPSDRQSGLAVPVWETYSGLLKEAGSDKPLEKVERFAFYERAKKSFAVVATGETSLYGNLIIKKGVIPAEDQC
ncbi:hypothetical protein ANANG_G00304800 [Anguilla anguilla]|uniref:L-fucose mutarotase n=1 Tax=Anguilla anguilla TaxID=7936 RepID=A0A9D3LNC9_ANGAN|nr:hypothetical protein ANANG_G00304800 [Anguilla anguilla]